MTPYACHTVRVVVTGIGVVSCVGLGVERFHQSLRDGVDGRSRVSAFDSAGFDYDYVCEVSDFEPEKYVRNQPIEKLGRSSRFAVAASRMAFEDAGLAQDGSSNTSLAGTSVPTVVGTTDGESAPFEALTQQMHQSAMQRFSPGLLEQTPAQSLALAVSREFELTGEALTISTACAAGNYSIGVAFDLVRMGEARLALCGGSDSICRKTFAGFYRLGTMAPENCQPFDENRAGILTGEGSAMLVLESLESAQRRGAKIYAEILGYAVNCDADHMVAPNRDSIADCMRSAHRDAGVAPADVDFICMHGTGTKSNDVTESQAVRAVFGEQSPPVTSIKSSLGHGMGAASAFGAAACCLAIDKNFLPPTINLRQQDPDCEVDVVANTFRPVSPDVVQNDAFAFGGNNAIVIFRRFDG